MVLHWSCPLGHQPISDVEGAVILLPHLVEGLTIALKTKLHKI